MTQSASLENSSIACGKRAISASRLDSAAPALNHRCVAPSAPRGWGNVEPSQFLAPDGLSEQMSEQLGASQARAAAMEQREDPMSRLESSVTRLVERYRDARQTVQQLQVQVGERDRRIAELNERVYALSKTRGVALKRLEGVISAVEQLERRGAAEA